MAGDSTHVIDDNTSLQAWMQKLRTIVRPRNLPIVLVQLPEFSSGWNQSLSALANGYRSACGCASSGFLMSVAAVSSVVFFFISGGTLSDISIPHALSFLSITVLAALSGKLLGLFWARWRLLRLAASMHNMIVRTTQRAVTDKSA